jgi:hypothetical protein
MYAVKYNENGKRWKEQLLCAGTLAECTEFASQSD